MSASILFNAVRPRNESRPGQARTTIHLILTLVLLGGYGCGPAPDVDQRPPNVVLVSVDTLRADAIEPYGGPVETSTFDELADEGVLFERAFSTAGETAPSHATLFTGQHVLRHRVTRNGVPLAEELETLGELFKANGYATAAFVSSFVLDSRFGWNSGFDLYDDQFPEDGATMDKKTPYNGAIWVDREFAGLDRRAEMTNSVVAEWLENAPEPFFLFIHYFDPHAPYVPPTAYAEKVADLEIDLEGRTYSFPGPEPGLVWQAPPEELVRINRSYMGEVMYLDDSLQELRTLLDKRESGRSTLLVVTADHGESLGQHNRLEHGTNLHTEQLHVPLLVHWPNRVPAGIRIETPISLVDVAPTIVELARLPSLAEAQGQSLANSLINGDNPPGQLVFSHRRELHPSVPDYLGQHISVRKDRWVYIHRTSGQDALFDTRNDPGELEDLLTTKGNIASELNDLIKAHMAANPKYAPEEEPPEEVREKLKALGYIQ